MAEAVYVRDVNRKIIYLNPAAQRLTGWSAAESLGAACYELFGSEGCSADQPCPLEAVLRQGAQPATLTQVRGVCGGGSVYVRASASWTGRPGGLRGMLVTMVPGEEPAEEPVQPGWDVGADDDGDGGAAASAAAHDPEAVAEYASGFAEAYRDAEVGMALTTLDGTFVEVNPALMKLLGRAREELLATSVIAVTHPDDVRESKAFRDALLAGGADSSRLEKRYLRPEGSVVWADVSTFVLRDDRCEPLCFISQTRDITERKLWERKLQEREQDFERAQRLAHAGDWSYDPATDHLVWSDELYRTFERDPGLGPIGPVDFEQVVPPDDWKAFSGAFAAALRDGTPYRLELRFRTDKGASRTMISVCEPIMGPDGRVVRLAGSIVDITELKSAEQALRNSEARYRELFNWTNAGAIVFEPTADGEDFVIVELNHSAERIDGVRREGVMGRLASEALPGFAESGLQGIVQRVARTGLPDYRPAAPYPHPVGRQWREYYVYGLPMGDVVALYENVTLLKQAEQELSSRTRVMDAVLAASPVGIALVRDRTICWVNEAFALLVGHSEHDVLGKGTREFYAEESEWRRVGERLDLGAAADSTLGTDTVWKRADGGHFHCHLQARLLVPDDASQGHILMATDISERLALEKAQRLAAVGQLAAGVAHEFNNVLAAMSGRAQLAQMYGGGNEIEQLIETVLSATERGAAISRNLLSFARPQEPRREWIAIDAPVAAALALASRELANAQVRVARRLHTDDLRIYGDPGQLEQVFLNLVINACHAMPGGGELTIAAEHTHAGADAGEVCVTVTDTGNGIRPEDVPRVFEPFFTTKGVMGEGDIHGTGLGLSVTHGIIAAHGGSVHVRSEPGHGTTFEIRLPARTEHETQPAAATDITAGIRLAGRRALLAEDEPHVSGALVAYLERLGCAVTEVADTAAALEAMSREVFDLVITDLMMPGAGGQAVLDAARSAPVPVPVIVMTGRGGQEVDEELGEPGAIAVLCKPFGFRALALAAAGLLAG
jgi:two-component system, cell cycle sensor histidine kinase and response regulator CckA